MRLTRRSPLAAAGLALSGGALAASADGQDAAPLYYPPGFRLGIRKPADLASRTGDLLSADQTLESTIGLGCIASRP